MHTHSYGPFSYNPSTETSNSLGDPKGGDFAHLESRLKFTPGTAPSTEPLYLSAPESPPKLLDIYCHPSKLYKSFSKKE